MSSQISCHYDVLGIEQDSDDATIKKAHRKLALKYHPDKNTDNPELAADQFRRVQEAYECLSDPVERKWYDDHRDAILKGWSGKGGGDDENIDFVFDVVPFMHAGCFRGFNDNDEKNGFFQVYSEVFRQVYESDLKQAGNTLDKEVMTNFGNADSSWEHVSEFYQQWESFTSACTFAWADLFDVSDMNRRARRAFEEDNKKARRTAKRQRNDEVLAFVRFVKRRDPRVKAQKEKMAAEKAQKERLRVKEAARKKQEAKEAREEWRRQQEEELEAAEEEVRLAGRIRLADLDDDYDYGGKKGKKGKKKKGKNKQVEEENHEQTDADADDAAATQEAPDGAAPQEVNEEADKEPIDGDDDETLDGSDEDETESEEEEPDVWRCECCRKDFKSKGQLENHFNSKKHKMAWKKFQQKQ